ncbi:hypothetical protein JCM3775_005273 [Rhodotorula graminis]
MQPRRRREASTQSEWPQLSLLAVYSETAIVAEADEGARLDDAALEAAKVLCLVSPGGQEALEGARRGRVMGTVMGVAAFARTLGPVGQEAARAVHSSRRRMLWCEVEPGFFVHATIVLPRSSRHSRRASAATTSSSATTSTPSFSLDDDVLLADLRHAYREYRLRHGSLVATLEKDGTEHVRAWLDEFWRDWAERWDVTGARAPAPLERVLDALPRCSLLTPSTSPQLLPLLAQFAASNPSTLPILLHDSTVLSLPDLASSASTSSRVGHTPPPPLANEDLLALVRYLHRLLPPRSLAVHAAASGVGDAVQHAASSSAADDTSTSSWTAPFSSLASGMTSFLAPRPMSFALSSPSSPSSPPSASVNSAAAPSRDAKDVRGKSLRSGFAALRRAEKDVVAERQRNAQRTASGGGADARPQGEPGAGDGAGWNFRSVSGSWSRLGFGGGAAAPATVAKAQAEAAAHDGSTAGAEENARDAAALEPPTTEGDEPASVPAAELDPAEEATPQHSQPTTPLVELAPSVDVGELAEAMGASPGEERTEAGALAVDGAAQDVGPPGGSSEEEDRVVEREKMFELVCGGEEGSEEEVRFHLRRYERGALTLGLAMLPKTDHAALAWLDSRAERLLEAVESLLEVVQPPVPAYPQQHFVKHGLLVSAFSPSSSSSPRDEPGTGSAAARPGSGPATDEELATTAALLDAYRSLRSPTVPVLESLTRLATPSTPWIVHRRTDTDPPHSCSSSSSTVPPPAGRPTVAQSATDVYAVLCGPSGSAKARGKGGESAASKKGGGGAGGAAMGAGAEMSLVEAADEMRRLVGAYGARA